MLIFVCIFASESKQASNGHKNSRQAKFAFSDKRTKPLAVHFARV